MFHPDTLIKLGRQQQHEILQQVRYGGQAQDIERFLRNENLIDSTEPDFRSEPLPSIAAFESAAFKDARGKWSAAPVWLRTVLAVFLAFVTN